MDEADPPDGNGHDVARPPVGIVNRDRADTPTPDQARAALSRVLNSTTFAQAGRLTRFLRFAGREALAGRGDHLKEYVVGVEVFDRPGSFNPASDSVVRVEARRLRAKLDAYYAGEGRDDDIRIELPKGSYVPVFRLRAPEPASSPAPAEGPLPGTSREPVVAPAHRLDRRRAALVAVPLLLIVAVALLWVRATSPPTPEVVAVLPFEQVGGGQESQHFAFGFVEELTARLSRVDGIRVVARTSAAQHARGDDVATIARRLRATAIVEGSVRRAGQMVRITTQLIDASDGNHLWAHSYERDASDVFATQEQVANEVTAAIVERLTGKPLPVTTPQTPASPAALEAYWRGRVLRGQRTPGSRRDSVAHFEQSVALAPEFAVAHAALGEVYATMSFHGEMPAEEGVAKARASVARALALGEGIAEAHNTLAWIHFFYDWNWPAAEREFQRAISLNPSFGGARQLYALGLTSRGRFDEAVAQSRMAMELDPLSYVASSDMAAVFYSARRYDEAIRHATRAIEMDPSATVVLGVLGSSYAGLGRYEEALVAFEKARAVYGPVSFLLARVGQAEAKLGRLERARAHLADLERTAAAGEAAQVHLAILYAALGDADRAVTALATACDRREGDVPFLGVEPLFDPLRADPRFLAILARVGLAR